MMRRLLDRRLIVIVLVVLGLFAVALLAPHPTVSQMREWADSVGPMFPLVFFLVHALVTVAPVPRTIFTLSAGVLFGSAMGIALTIAATTVSAILALYLVRAIGRDVVWQRISSPTIRRVDERIEKRGWLAVGSLRLIAFAPFSVVNYCCGISSIRLVPYVLATVVGILPGTVGIVVLGDALSGEADPRLLILSGICIAVGIGGLLFDARKTTADLKQYPVSQPIDIDLAKSTVKD
ncbi:TVP38/TMEM64 family protein [Rhodococcus sp. OK302]|uniref:TVP38/TMEM64 family protein n=1 Tax=Rhodococcus sp. OK302 TaxID=1882769 RepID=UPI000B93B6A5|nr:TVP38/TMEM64 family protein [Rhodococcus sp. OK302]